MKYLPLGRLQQPTVGIAKISAFLNRVPAIDDELGVMDESDEGRPNRTEKY